LFQLYGIASMMMNKALERALGKVLRLPQDQQDIAAELLEQVAAAASGPYELSDDERTIVQTALTRANRGEFASDEAVTSVLRRPWRGA
jgi:hypothetical protein